MKSHRLALLVLLVASSGTFIFAQGGPSKSVRTSAAAKSRVVSIRMYEWVGFCGQCYCGSDLEVTSQGATLFETPTDECKRRDPGKYREFRVDADISSKHWKELAESVDQSALFKLPDSTGCASCVDGVDQRIEVRFDDGKKKSVRYPAGDPPKELKDLSERLVRRMRELESELVNLRPHS